MGSGNDIKLAGSVFKQARQINDILHSRIKHNVFMCYLITVNVKKYKQTLNLFKPLVTKTLV